MAAPNIVNVATITGITTFIAGINTGGTGGPFPINTAGVTTILSNASGSGKVLKVNSLVAAGSGTTTGVTVEIYDSATATGAANTVAIGQTISVPQFSSVVVISKENSIYLEENRSLGVYAEPDAGNIDVVLSYEDIS
jgi:hypothetical protein|tara:strand:+ start:13 stop:426 length:414 start_codon:yes stop_codon:yes gene_type:complete